MREARAIEKAVNVNVVFVSLNCHWELTTRVLVGGCGWCWSWSGSHRRTGRHQAPAWQRNIPWSSPPSSFPWFRTQAWLTGAGGTGALAINTEVITFNTKWSSKGLSRVTLTQQIRCKMDSDQFISWSCLFVDSKIKHLSSSQWQQKRCRLYFQILFN